MGAVVAGGGGAVAWGLPEKKLGMGRGARGMAGAAADRRCGVFLGRVGRRTAGRRRQGRLFGRWGLAAQGGGG